LKYNEQVEFYYQSKRCKGKDYSNSECEKDNSIQMNLRFYEIKVIATDWAGHVGSDTCRVAIVPDCNPQNENCEVDGQPPHKYRYNRKYLRDTMIKSDIRYDITSIKAEWKSSLLTLLDPGPTIPSKSPKSPKIQKISKLRETAGFKEEEGNK